MSTDKLAELYDKADNCLEEIDPELVEIVEEGDWEQEHKYQHATHIVKFDGKFYAVNEMRGGSYHTDWYYMDSTILPVERAEETKVVVTWKPTGNPVTVAGAY